ncbi:amidohydrolase [Flavobacterium sp. 5]|uniref:amidohydrolase n=1 Tax=Flavobacterium sp. 5 TaxID=2035199 RepID=UPI000C2C9D74|nr:amidohydrolase [Flavobacterium sp. 5]PKB15585.1 carboxypeptidase Ss1 [Flavobacterium sp. 5]
MKTNQLSQLLSVSAVLFFSTVICNKTTAQNKNYATTIATAADKIEPKVIDWRHDIHQNPELGNREVRTAALIAKHLQSLGIEVKTGVGITGVVGILKGDKPGPVVALRADMDALPVEEKNDLPFASKVKTTYNGKETPVMHACGHDAHVAILMGVAEILSGMKKDLKGTVKFIFQPAEEGAPYGEEGGAALMIKEGVLENPKVDVIFGLHMDAQTEVGKIGYRPGGIMAAVGSLKITVNGKGSHGAAPWSAIDPIVVSAQIINNLQTIVSRNVNITENPAVVTIASIHGGNRDNIISDKVEMLGTVRTFSDSDQKLIYDRVKQVAEKTAESAGATADVILPYEHYYPVTYNNEKLTAEMLPTLEKSAGKENVLLKPAITGAEDFSFFQKKVPGMYFFIGGLPKGADSKTSGPHHTSQFIIDDKALKTGLKSLSNLVLDYMEMTKK